MKQLKNNIGFDIGTSKLRIFKDGKLVTETPTELEDEGKIIDNLIVNGSIADFNATVQLLRQEIKKIQKPILGFLYPAFTSLVSVPSEMNEVALRAFRDAMEHAGTKTCFMLNDCFIAAKGLEIDIKNTCSMIVDSGAGKTSITTIRGCEIVRNDLFDIAGRNLDEAIQTYLSSKYELLIDKNEAERLKIEYVDFRKSEAIDRTVRITGKEKKTDTTKEITVQSTEITECLKKDIELLVEKIVRHFENLEDSDSSKIRSAGVHLIGGGFKLKGLIDLIAEKVNVSNKSYSVSSDYMKTGLAKIQSNAGDLYERMMK